MIDEIVAKKTDKSFMMKFVDKSFAVVVSVRVEWSRDVMYENCTMKVRTLFAMRNRRRSLDLSFITNQKKATIVENKIILETATKTNK